jgi:hypothetical protein
MCVLSERGFSSEEVSTYDTVLPSGMFRIASLMQLILTKSCVGDVKIWFWLDSFYDHVLT